MRKLAKLSIMVLLVASAYAFGPNAVHAHEDDGGAPGKKCDKGCSCHDDHSPICFVDHDDVCNGTGCIYHHGTDCNLVAVN